MNNTPISGSTQIEPQVIVVRGPRVRAVAEYRTTDDGVAAIGKDGRAVSVAMSVPLSDALTRQFDDDHHAVGYTLPDGFEPQRICKSALKSLAAISDEPVKLAVLMVDLDRPKHKPWGADADPATIVRARLAALPSALAGWGWFVTRGGARLVRPLATPMPITPATASDVEARICGVLVALANAGTGTLTLTTSAGARVLAGTDEGDADFVLDAACCDWTRLFRLPRVVRDGVVQEWPSDFSEMRPIELADVMPVAKPAPAARANSTPKAAKLTTKPQKAKPASREMVADGDGDGGPASGDALHTGTADESAVTRARMYMDSVPPAVEGQGGDQHTFRVCCAVVRGFDLNDDAAFDVLSGWNSTCAPPWSESELRSKIAGARLYGGGVWGYLLSAAPARESASAIGGDAPMGSELWFARRMAATFGQDVRYRPGSNRALVWDNARGYWIDDDDGAVMRLAFALSDELGREAAAVDPMDVDRRKAVFGVAKKFASRAALVAAVDLFSHLPDVQSDADQWNANPWLLGCANGTIDLRTGELRPSRREDYITRVSPVTYDVAAPAPRWDAFLRQVMPDAEMRDYLQRAAGYSATGIVREHVLHVAWGVGANGKTTFFEVLAAVLGELATAAPPTLLLKAKHERHPTEFATLYGRRLVTMSETPEGGRLSAETVKAIVGGDRIVTRRMHEDFWSFKPTAKIWLATNYRPHVEDCGHGLWRRMRLLPFTVTIPKEQQDADLKQKLETEHAGILRWIVEGARMYAERGLHMPTAVEAATAQYRDHEDALSDFVCDCIRTDTAPSAFVPASEVADAYEVWARANHAKPMSQRALTSALMNRGFDYHRRATARGWRGIRIVGSATMATAHHEPPAASAEPTPTAPHDTLGPLTRRDTRTGGLRLSVGRRAAM